jgi:ABC-type transport system involved in multi-copper enzyme maturation permease subunit
MFLFILQSSTLFPDTLKNPLLGIILTKSISRAGLFLSKYLGQIIAIFSLLLILGIGIVFILFFKTNEAIVLMPIYVSIFVFFEFVAIFTFMAPFSLIFEKPLAITVIGIITYFVLIPSLISAEKMNIIFASYVSYIFPPILKLAIQTSDAIAGETIPESAFISSIVYIIIYISISIDLFKQKDIA